MTRLKDAPKPLAIFAAMMVPFVYGYTSLVEASVIGVAATGYDVIDVPACRERGITVSNIRNYAVHTVPEHAFALILALRDPALRARIGETVRLVDHLRGIDVLCEVADPMFHDREGVKLRA